MNKRNYLVSAFLLTAVSYVKPVLAIDIAGNWVGTGSGVQFFCTDPAKNTNISSDVSVIFDEQSNNQIQVDFTGVDNIGTTHLLGSGLLSNGDAISAPLTGFRNNDEFIDYNFSGIFTDDNTLQYGGAGTNETCSYNFGGTLIRVFDVIQPLASDGETIIPEVAGSSDIIEDALSLSRVVIHSSSVINDRLQHLLIRPHLLKVTATGFNLNSGLAAGDSSLSGLGIWVSYDRSNFENTFIRTQYKGHINTFLVGVDYTLGDNVIIGSAFSYEVSDIDTKFNKGNVEISGYSILPYFGYLLNDNWNLNLSAGLSQLKYDQYRTFTGLRINSNTDSQRWFVSANLNGSWIFNSLLVSGSLGAITANSEIDRYIESNGRQINSSQSSLTTFSLGTEVAYIMGEFEPYFNVNLNHDNKSSGNRLSGTFQAPDDRNDILGALGLRYYGNQGLSITAELSKRFKRVNVKENNLSLMARWDF